uniref:Cns1/TTC4 wheel domain-containing protein n=1 Tax=Tetradesmus obliquus TaxID=3088 RepID=A0A383VM43_TETOB|eukprot:jgi/Sobl393_1/14142/SZX65764.1
MTGSLKDQGNELFKQGDYLKAAAVYTKAIKEAPSAVLYSNRSAALLKLNKVAKALADAEECVKLDPAFHKGYMRMALALESQQRLEEAVDCYRKAMQADNNNSEYAARAKALSKALGKKVQIEKAQSRRSPAETAALAFAESKLAYAAELAKEQGRSFAPELFFLQGRSSSGGGSSSSSSSSQDDSDEVAVRAEHAFAAPEVLAQFVQEMRSKAEELHATAVLLIAPKAAVQFPQTWRSAGWPFGQHDGVFVQLHASLKQATDSNSSSSSGPDQQAQDAAAGGRSSEGVLRKLWFIKFRENKPPVEPQEVSQEFELLPPLLQ